MDVLLVHYQPSSSGSVQVKRTLDLIPSTIATLGFATVMNYDFVYQACVVATLAALAYNQPHGMVPFLKVSNEHSFQVKTLHLRRKLTVPSLIEFELRRNCFSMCVTMNKCCPYLAAV